MYHAHRKCRACNGTDLVPVLDLGTQPLANDFRRPGEECAGMAPLAVLLCRRCSLAQLSVVVNPQVMYANYSYVTSKSETMKEHFEVVLDEFAQETWRSKELLEIGSNDGTFLLKAAERFKVLGFEPASNLSALAIERGVRTINRLFDESNAAELAATGYKADVIVARHVFCHVDYWQGFIRALELVSHKDTLVFIEVPYVKDMFKNASADQCYHEHLSYMSVLAMVHLLAGTKFKLHKIIPYEIHGGAIGIMLRHVEHEGMADVSVDQYTVVESVESLEAGWRCLAQKMQRNCGDLMKLVSACRGKVICGFGASAKATVFINACRFTKQDIAFVCDSTRQKQGCLVPGTDIGVVPETRLAWCKTEISEKEWITPDYAIIFAWNFASEIMSKNKDFKGRWIIPCPEVKIL